MSELGVVLGVIALVLGGSIAAYGIGGALGMLVRRRQRRKGLHRLLCGECGRTYVGPPATLCSKCYPGLRGPR